jgi:photoactive yellow protein
MLPSNRPGLPGFVPDVTPILPVLDNDPVTPTDSPASSLPLVQAAFYDDDLAETLRNASDDALHQAAFGIIQVDDRGVVTFYNRFEQRFSGRAPEETIGRSFFDEVAPCTRGRSFQGQFERGLEAGQLDVSFSYTFTYRIRPTLVDVRMLVDRPGEAWILIRPKAGTAA